MNRDIHAGVVVVVNCKRGVTDRWIEEKIQLVMGCFVFCKWLAEILMVLGKCH